MITVVYERPDHSAAATHVPAQEGETAEETIARWLLEEKLPFGSADNHFIVSVLPERPCEEWDVDWTNNVITYNAAKSAEALAALKLEAKRKVAARADAFAEMITGTIPRSEIASWPSKEVAAEAHQAQTATARQTAMLQAEANLTGETLDELAAKILANSTVYNPATGMIAGQRRTVTAAIDALTDIDTFHADVAAIFATAEAQSQALLAQLQG